MQSNLMYIYVSYSETYIIYIYSTSRTGTRKEWPREKGSIGWLQSGSTEASSVGALYIWQVRYQERNVDAGMLMIMVHAS